MTAERDERRAKVMRLMKREEALGLPVTRLRALSDAELDREIAATNAALDTRSPARFFIGEAAKDLHEAGLLSETALRGFVGFRSDD